MGVKMNHNHPLNSQMWWDVGNTLLQFLKKADKYIAIKLKEEDGKKPIMVANTGKVDKFDRPIYAILGTKNIVVDIDIDDDRPSLYVVCSAGEPEYPLAGEIIIVKDVIHQ